MNKITRIAIAIIVCLTVGYSSSTVTKSGVETWYPTIAKPVFNPPNWVFMPVWTILFILMGIAAGLVWNNIKEQNAEVKKALGFFLIQLALNAIWSYLFFGIRRMDIAFVDALLMWVTVALFIVLAAQVSTVAALLFVPYLIWVTIAATLNRTVWRLNPAA